MKKQLNSVKEFHDTYKLGYSDKPLANLGNDKNNLRFNLMNEENNEYLNAAKNDDIIEVADALGDMLYILCGTIIEHGMQDIIEPIFDGRIILSQILISFLSNNKFPLFVFF